MMEIESLGKMDIYLIDQLMKGRYLSDHRILDAGCGSGKNLIWFFQNGFDLFALDKSEEAIVQLSEQFPLQVEKILQADLLQIPFENEFFDHILSSAVLHFAESSDHFEKLFQEHLRVLKPGGTFWIRMCSDIGIEQRIVPVGHGLYKIPDGTVRFLITRKKIQELILNYPIQKLEPVKTTNVSDIRCMTTLLFAKT